MFILKKPRLFIAGAALIALIAFVYMWRGEIIKGAENAYKSILANEVITVNKKSKMEADNVKIETQNLDDDKLRSSVCDLGIVWDNKGCDSY